MRDLRTIFVGKTSFFVLIILGLAVINATWLVPTLRNVRVSASVFALTVAERIQSEINGSLGNALNEITGVAGEVGDEPDRTVTIFNNLLRYHPIFTSVSLIDRSGRELVHIDSSGPLGLDQLGDQSKNTSFYLALQGRTTFTPPVILPNGEAHANLVVPVPKQGEFIEKVIIAELNVQNLLSIIRSVHIGQGQVYVLDRDGIEILNPDPDKILQHKDLSSRRIVKKVLVDGVIADGLAKDDQYINDAGEDTFTVGIPIPVVKWGVFVEQARSQALAGERQAILLAILTSILAMIIFLVIAFSIIKLRELTARLEAANERLQELDTLKSEFVSIAGHQLRAPLTVIKGYVSLILEGTIQGASDAVKDALGKVMFSTEQLIKLVSGLLDLSRIESGKIKYEMTEGNLAAIVTEVADKFKAHAKKKGIELVFKNHAGEARFMFDQDKIREAVVNYLDNAIKYSEKGRIVITLDTIGSGMDSRVRLSVKDAGLGMKPEEISKLFGKFARLEEAKTTDPNGMGIGLYFVKKIITDHGGRVWAESEGIGKGSTFFMELAMRTTAVDQESIKK